MKKAIAYTVCIVTIALISVFLSMGHDWPHTDFLNQQIPFILETKRMLASGHPWWSWNTFVGDNFIGGYAFYTITSPFVWLVCLFPANLIMWGILLSFYLKSCCTVAFAYLYFKKMGFSQELCTLGGLLYCFSSFFICNLFYFHFCEPIMVFPILLLSIEKVLNNETRGFFWLAVTSFAMVFINYYFAFSSLLLGALYFFIRGFSKKRLSFLFVMKTIGCVLLGVCMASVILLPTILHHIGAPRLESTEAHLSLNGFIYQIVGRIKSLIMPTSTENGSTLLANACCSVEPYITLFGMLPTIVYCFSKRNWLTSIIIIILILFFPPLNGLFSGFTNEVYSRYLYGMDIFLILSILYVIQNKITITGKNFVVYMMGCVAIIILSIIVHMLAQHKVDIVHFRLSKASIIDLLLWGINSIFLAIWIFKKTSTSSLILLVCLCGCIHLSTSLYLYSHQIYSTDKMSTLGNNDLFYKNIFSNKLDGTPTHMEYRTDAFSNYRNYSLLNNKPGLYSFHSSMNKKLVPIRSTVSPGVASPELIVTRHRDSFGALFSVKDILDYRDSIT
ncbi:MAG: YfhO family protein, partial [Muribaculaceae bacterium]|nr:YfhO family protein [Muribaculaceae bacterium]